MSEHRLHSGSPQQYVKDLVERAIASFAGGALSVLGVGAIDLVNVNWVTVVTVGAGAAVVSILKSVAAKSTGDANNASLVPSLVTKPVEEIAQPQPQRDSDKQRE